MIKRHYAFMDKQYSNAPSADTKHVTYPTS